MQAIRQSLACKCAFVPSPGRLRPCPTGAAQAFSPALCPLPYNVLALSCPALAPSRHERLAAL